MDSYLGNLFKSIDQTGNALAWGNRDNTISGRIGYYSNHAITTTKWYWKSMEFIVDTTFYPFDGTGHCHEAYHKDSEEEYYPNKYAFLLFVLSLITLCSCLILVIPFYVLYFLGIIKQKQVETEEEELVKNNVNL